MAAGNGGAHVMATAPAPPAPPETRTLPIDAIRVGRRRRPLSAAVVAGLVDSIGRVGLLNPITVTADGQLVAGWHRLEACRQLGKSEVLCATAHDDDVLARLAECDENLIRNDLTALERAQHLKAREDLLTELGARRGPGGNGSNQHHRNGSNPAPGAPLLKTTKHVAAEVGLSERSAQEHLQIARAILPDVQDAIRGTDAADRTKSLVLLARQPAPVQRAIAAKLAARPALEVITALKDLHREEVAYGIADAAATVQAIDGVAHGDFRELCADVVPDESVDLIFTDPPYTTEGLPLYGDLAAFASRVLRPGALLCVYSGHTHLPENIDLLRSTGDLRYVWAFCVHRDGDIFMNAIRVNTHWRPLLMFSKGPPTVWWTSAHDVVRARREKQLFHWQQSEGEAGHFVGSFTPPGALVVDPMCGTGTTLTAAKRAGRRFLGVEIDAGRAAQARERLAGVVPEDLG